MLLLACYQRGGFTLERQSKHGRSWQERSQACRNLAIATSALLPVHSGDTGQSPYCSCEPTIRPGGKEKWWHGRESACGQSWAGLVFLSTPPTTRKGRPAENHPTYREMEARMCPKGPHADTSFSFLAQCGTLARPYAC